MGTDMKVVMKGTAYNYQYKKAKEIKESTCLASFNLQGMGGTGVVENTDNSCFVHRRLVRPMEEYHGKIQFKGKKKRGKALMSPFPAPFLTLAGAYHAAF